MSKLGEESSEMGEVYVREPTHIFNDVNERYLEACAVTLKAHWALRDDPDHPVKVDVICSLDYKLKYTY